MITQKLLLLLSSVLFLASFGCVSKPTLSDMDPSDPFEGKTALLFAFKTQGNMADLLEEGCRFIFLDAEGREIIVPITSKKPIVYIEVPPGPYLPNQISCAPTKRWEFAETAFKSFNAQKGKVNFVGQFFFNMNLGRVAVGYKNLAPDEASRLRDFYKELSPNAQANLVSIWTQKKITEAMIKENDKTFQLFWTAPSSLSFQSLMDAITTCATDEAARNPSLMGQAEVVARYKNTKFSDLSEEKSQTTGSAEYVGCVHQALKSYSPNIKAAASVRALF